MTTKVDKEKCIGCGNCAMVCDDGFKLKDGKAVVKNPGADCAKKAEGACPEGAIDVEG